MKGKEKIRRKIEKRYEYWREKEHNSHSIESEIRMSECQHLLLLFNSLQEEPVSKDLEEAAEEYAPYFSNSIASKAAVDAVRDAFRAGAEWRKEQITKVLLSEVLPCFMHGGEADEVVAKLDEVLNQK